MVGTKDPTVRHVLVFLLTVQIARQKEPKAYYGMVDGTPNLHQCSKGDAAEGGCHMSDPTVNDFIGSDDHCCHANRQLGADIHAKTFWMLTCGPGKRSHSS